MLPLLLLGLTLSQAVPEAPPPPPPPAPPTAYPPAPPPSAPTPYNEPPPGEAGEAPKPTGAYVPDEGFRLQDESGNNMLRFGLQSAFRFQPSWTNGDEQTRGAIGFLRPILRGNVYRKWITFWVSMELAGNPPYLLDAYFDIVPMPQFAIRAGQQYSPYDRQEQLGPQQLFFPEWSPVADWFWPGRDRGILVYGSVLQKRMDYSVALFSGTPLRQVQTLPGNYDAEGRVAFNPLGPVKGDEFPFNPDGSPLPFRYTIGLQAHGGKVQKAEENFNPVNGQLFAVPTGKTNKLWGGGADILGQGGWFVVNADAHYRHTEPTDGSPSFNEIGAWAQAIMGIVPNQLAAGVQVDWLDPNTDSGHDNAYLAEAELAYFIHNPGVVLKLRYEFAHQQRPDDPTETPPLTPGDLHLITLQFNLSF